MRQRSTKRVLFVSYLFPPTGGVGVHRVTKFVKHLPEFGWKSSVLTVSNPSAPLTDDSLCRDVPSETIVRRARTLEPGYGVKQSLAAQTAHRGIKAALRGAVRRAARGAANALLQPDPQILWRPAAVREGLRLLRETPHQAIIATGPPFSSLLVGAALSRKTRLPLILDYRDEWGISNAYWENKQPSAWASRVQARMQASAVRAADVLLATTPGSAAHLAEVGARAGSQARATWIYNGFDPDDARTARLPQPLLDDTAPRSGRFRLACVGTLWNLNPIGPVVDGIRRLASTDPEYAGRLELVVAGRRTAAQEAELDRLKGLPCRVIRLPFISHDEAVGVMQDADALLLLNADLPHTDRIINAKTFEYMAARRPLLAVAPEGDLWDVVRPLPGCLLRRPSDVGGIAAALQMQIERHRRGVGEVVSTADWDLSPYERRHLTGELAVLLDELVCAPSTQLIDALSELPQLVSV